MRNSKHLKHVIFAWAAIACAATSFAAQAKAFDGFGLYHKGSVDSVEDILILPDHSFCVAVTAGSLDLLTAGRWTSAGDHIVLDEIKQQSAPVIVIWQVSPRPQDRGKVVFEFSGQTFGSQGTFVFGASESDQLPKDIHPLFSSEANGFESIYAVTRAAGIKTFVLAYRAQEQADRGPYHVLQYRLPEAPPGAGLRLRSYYDEQAAAPAIHLVGRMSGGSLKLNNESLGKPAPAAAGDRATCAAALKRAEDGGADVARPGPKRLAPAQISDVDLHLAASTKPLFKTSSDPH